MSGAFLTAAQPFAWTTDDGTGEVDTTVDTLVPRKVTQCALSRVCGVCADPLGRPVAFVGTDEEVGRNAFHAPPLHERCAADLLARVPGWTTVLTSGFEFVRPHRDDPDRRVRFVPNSLV